MKLFSNKIFIFQERTLFFHVFHFICHFGIVAIKGPRRPYYNPIFSFSTFFENKTIFRSSYTISSIIVAWETRLTKKAYLPNRTCVGASLVPQIKAYIHPNLIVLPVHRSKARIVVFASRKALPEFWLFCSS